MSHKRRLFSPPEDQTTVRVKMNFRKPFIQDFLPKYQHYCYGHPFEEIIEKCVRDVARRDGFAWTRETPTPTTPSPDTATGREKGH